MNSSDKQDFKDLMNGLADYYKASNPKQEYLGKMALQIYFGALDKYSIDQVIQSASSHVSDVKNGQFFPKAADLIRHIEGGEITTDMIISSARLADTPLGCLARVHIGTWDLNNGDSFYLKARASECLQKLPEWKTRAFSGKYSDHEISVMLKHNVRPTSPFYVGLLPPENFEEIVDRSIKIKKSERHLEFIRQPYEPEEGSTTLPALMESMNREVKSYE